MALTSALQPSISESVKTNWVTVVFSNAQPLQSSSRFCSAAADRQSSYSGHHMFLTIASMVAFPLSKWGRVAVSIFFFPFTAKDTYPIPGLGYNLHSFRFEWMDTKPAKRTPRTLSPPEKRRKDRSPLHLFSLKFLLAAAITVSTVSLIPEDRYGPLNRITALFAGELIRLLPVDPVIRGALISIGGFSVNVIAECTAVHLVALYAAFIFAFPAKCPEKWIGLGSGTLLLFTVNIARIAAVTLIGRYFPTRFEVVHVYLGQLGMLVVVIVMCLAWCHWISNRHRGEGAAGFLLRFFLFSSLPFLLWLPLNRYCIAAIDGFIQWLFILASHPLTIPRTHALYYQTFSLVALCSLLLAIKEAELALRLRWMAYGVAVLTLFQVAFRLCNVWITAFQIGWLVPVSQIIYAICVYALPLAVALGLLMPERMTLSVSHRKKT